MRWTTGQDQKAETQKGTIKWFSQEKGYGFIDGNDGIRRFFHVADTVGDFSPKTGNFIFFEPRQDRKGPRAVGVRLNPDSLLEVGRTYSDGRISCPYCSKLIVPRITFWYGRPNRSFCPYCGGEVRNFFREGPVGIFLEMIIRVAFFSAYVMTLLIGFYFLMTEQRDSNIGSMILGMILVAPAVAKLVKCTRRLASGIRRTEAN
ncbi:cold shock domain-containing protein [Methylococcus sp. EFPC2]|uniref:cold shock domain-containing protein n=1 Tax=Methylococcus sp. EFPC2 TaxID=2812648 RepID=UPI00196716D3|nr:cold shock domain-containing protein [Methylococcus sp. EFPC2]QSA98129.1 cold shock domain-containing protein [Methylococcus sp. EFPC2]